MDFIYRFFSLMYNIIWAWADCVAHPKIEAMREPDRGISEK